MSEITINADLWNRLSPQEQGDVEAQLRASHVLDADDRVVGGYVSPPADLAMSTTITIDAYLWDRLSSDEQADVEAQLRASHVLGADDRVVGGYVSPPADLVFDMAPSTCKKVCQATAAVASVACVALGDPLLIAACQAVVGAGRQLCLRACD